jgi:2-dehydropantoate 2-reductase
MERTPGSNNIAVVGLGSIGGIVAGYLAKTGRHRVFACVRKVIAELTLDGPDGTTKIALPALTDIAKAEAADWVLLCTKTHQTEATAPWLARLCTPRTRVAVLQNGVDHVARVAPLVNGATVVPVIVYYNGERIADDHMRLRQGADQDLLVAGGETGRAFALLFDGTPLRVSLSDDFATAAWRKLLINIIASPITALTLQRQAVLRRPDVKSLCLELLAEAIAVARAEGAKLRPDEADAALTMLFTFPPEAGTSMYFDRFAGRPLEYAALNGAIVAAGERHGIPTPINRALLPLLHAISDAATKS